MNGKQFPNEGLSLYMDHEKISVTDYRTLFVGSGIHHSNAGHQITHDIFVNGYFILLFVLTTDRRASECQTSHPDKPLPEAITCLLYLKFHNSVLINLAREAVASFADLNAYGV